MTIIIGARCKDGVALVGDRRVVRVESKTNCRPPWLATDDNPRLVGRQF